MSESELDLEIMQVAAELAAVRRAKKQIAEEEDILRKKLLAYFEANGIALTAAGEPAFTVRESTRTSVDRKKLEALYPAIFEDVRKESVVKTVDIHEDAIYAGGSLPA